MERSFYRSLDCYAEKHHIVPKCMGGDDKPRNIAILTPEEHYLAHQLLVKIYPKNSKLTYAANMMTVSGKCDRSKNKQFGWLKRELSKNQTGMKNHMFGKEVSKETREKISASSRGKKKQPFTDEHKKNIGLKSKGRRSTLGIPCSIETKEKIRKSLSGRKLSDEHRANLCNRRCSDECKIKLAERNRSEGSKTRKLSDKDIVNIRLRYKNEKTSYRLLAEQYGVTKGSISNIINNRTWTNLTQNYNI